MQYASSLTILSLLADVRSSRVVVQERSTSESNAVKVEDDVNGINRPRLVSNFHSTENDLVQEAGEAILRLGMLLADLR